MLTSAQASELKARGLDYYKPQLDTSADYYAEIITTRSYQDRLDTLAAVRAAGLKVVAAASSAWRVERRSRRAAAHAGQSARASRERTINQLVKVPVPRSLTAGRGSVNVRSAPSGIRTR